MIAKIVCIGLLGAALVCAQGKKGPGGGSSSMERDLPMAPSQNRMDMMEKILKLNKDQKKQVKSIMDDSQKEAVPVRDQIVKSEADLGESIAEGKSQDEIDKSTAACGDLQTRMAAIEMKAFAKVYQTLDKDQQANAGQIFFMMQGIFKGKNWTEVKQ